MSTSDIHLLQRPEGRIAYDVTGEDGPLVVCVPGMGDLRSVYRHVVPQLVAAGHRVVTMDLRGHGDSDVGFTEHDAAAAGSDVVALVEAVGGPAVLVGNSLGAGAAVWTAAERPDLVSATALLGPFVRDLPTGPAKRLAMRLALLRPWGPAIWRAFYAKLNAGTRPPDLREHLARLRASLRRPGRWAAFVATTWVSHAPVEARLDQAAAAAAPTLVVMGRDDPDFPDPSAEADLVARRLGAEVLLVDDAGHYPQAQQPDVVGPALVDLVARSGQARPGA